MSAPVPTDPDLNPTAFAARHGRPKYGSFAQPPCPLPPDLRSDVAHRRGEGHTWDQVGVALRYDPEALYQACDADPDYEVAEARAGASARRALAAGAQRRLLRLLDADSERVALEAAEVALRFESECRKYEAREKAEETRATTARLKVYAQKPHLWAEAAPRPAPLNLPPLPAERGASREARREPCPGRFAPRGVTPPSRGAPVSAGAVRNTACDDAPPG